jgi:hypothetical protein
MGVTIDRITPGDGKVIFFILVSKALTTNIPYFYPRVSPRKEVGSTCCWVVALYSIFDHSGLLDKVAIHYVGTLADGSKVQIQKASR